MTRRDVVRELMAEKLKISGAMLDLFLELYAEAARLDNENGGVSPSNEAPQKNEPIPAAKGKPGPKAGVGAGSAGRDAAALKKRTHTRLVAYRNKNGSGCYNELVKITNGAITDDEIREMAEAAKMPMAKWEILSGALDIAERSK